MSSESFRYNTSSLDTCLIIRAIIKDIPSLYKKVETLLADETAVFIIDDLAITESAYVLDVCYALSRAEIVSALKAFLASSNLSFSKEIFEKVFDLYLSRPKLSLNDIYLSVKSEQTSSEPLWTFDKKLASQLPSPKLLN